MKDAGSGFARPYVDALFEVAGTPDTVEALLAPLDTFSRAVESSEELRAFLKNPAVGRKEKRALVEELARSAAVPELAGRLLRALLDRGRILKIEPVLKAIRARLDREKGVVEATVQSAAPLDAEAEKGIREALEARVGTRVRLRTELDPSLLSGFVVRLASEVFDASLSRRLKRARKALESSSGAA